jgi:hypothetical protein
LLGCGESLEEEGLDELEQPLTSIIYETGHVLGLGHSGSPSVMRSRAALPSWNTTIQFATNTETDFLWGYCPNGSSPNCQ